MTQRRPHTRTGAQDMSTGKGNHCKSHSVTCASFWKKKKKSKTGFLCPLSFPPHFGCVLTVLHTRHSSIASPERGFFSPPSGYSLFSTRSAARVFFFLLLLLIFFKSETPARVWARLEQRSGDEDRFPAYLSDLVWNSVRVRWADL